MLQKNSSADNDTSWVTLSGGGLALPLTQNLTFSPDNTYSIGTSAANRPSTLYAATSVVVGTTSDPQSYGFATYTFSVVTNPTVLPYQNDYWLKLSDTSGASMTNLALVPTGTNQRPSFGLFDSADVTNASAFAMVKGASANWDALETSANGTGTVRGIAFWSGTSNYQFWSSSATVLWQIQGGHLLTGTDNTYDIGASGATRPRMLYAVQGLTLGIAGALVLGQATNAFVVASAGSLVFGVGSTQYWRLASSGGHFQAITDNVVDIGASGVNRPRDLWLGRNLSVIGTTQHTGNVGIGVAPVLYSGIYFQPTMSGANQFALYAPLTFSTSGTGNNFVFYTLPTFAASTRTVAAGASFYADSPSVGAGVAITTMAGFYAANQGASGVVNAYGIYIAAQSGASTTNLGLYNAGSEQIQGTLTLNGSVVQALSQTAQFGRTGIGTAQNNTDPGYDLRVNGAAFMGSLVLGGGNLSTTGSISAGGPLSGQSVVVSSNTGLTTNSGSQNLYLGTNGVSQWVITTAGHLLPNTDTQYDIGQATGGYKPRNLYVGGSVNIGSANERIRNPANSATNLSIESADGNVLIGADGGAYAASNAYWDGTNWNRYNTAQPAMLSGTVFNSSFYVGYAASGANPLSWTTVMSVTGGGFMDVVGMRANGTATAVSGAGLELYYSGGQGVLQGYNRTSSAYVPVVLIGSNVFLQPMGSGMVAISQNGTAPANTAGAVLVFNAAVGPKINLYDAGASGFFGEGINSAEMFSCIPTSSSWVWRQTNGSGGACMSLNCASSNLTIAGALYLANTTTNYCSSDGTNIIFFSAGAFFTRVTGLYNQNGSGQYVTVYASAFSVQSTRKSKTDLVPLVAPNALAQVLDERVTPLAYTHLNGDRHLGFVAEDMQDVVPEAVKPDYQGDPGINYGALVPVLWSAVRELSARLEALEKAA